LATRNSNVLVVHPSLPVRNMAELVKFARARPGQLNYGSAAAGTTSHVGAELLKHVAKLDIVRVPFRGATSALNSLLSGQVQLLFLGGSTAVSQIQTGRLRPLAVASPEPSPIFPGVPTMAAAGLPGVEVFSIFGVLAPARTPPAIITLLNQEIGRALQTPEAKARLQTVGSETVGGPPDVLSAAMRAEYNRIENLSRSVSLRDE
jgi:tripartite-type tricarboxylate transporter receptor subunit TctC